MLRDRRGSNMAEAAITMPVVLMVLMLVINASLAGYTAMAASNAASYAARVGAVARDDPEGWASNAVVSAMRHSGAGGSYSYSVKADKEPGGAVKVMVSWRYPTMLAGLCRFFGGNCAESFKGETTATVKREGW